MTNDVERLILHEVPSFSEHCLCYPQMRLMVDLTTDYVCECGFKDA